MDLYPYVSSKFCRISPEKMAVTLLVSKCTAFIEPERLVLSDVRFSYP
jgi:hypothetical protein